MAGSVLAPAAAQAQEGPEPGKGDSYAQGFKIDPRSGELSFGITFGMALALHQNNFSAGEVRSLDLGVIGTTLAGEGCSGGDPTLPAEDQPQPLAIRTDEDGNTTQSDSENAVSREVTISDQPFVRSTARTAAVDVGGLITISGARSVATSGVVEGRRIARAVSEVGELDIAGVLSIRGMRWVAEYESAPDEATITDFSIDGVHVAGTNLLGVLAGGTDFAEPLRQLTAINDLLEPLGLGIHVPEGRTVEGVAVVDPLTISIAPREGTSQLFTLLGPLRSELTGALFDISCSFGTPITILDLVTGTISGSGSLNLELGGVMATSDEVVLADLPSFDLPDGGATPAPTTATPDTTFNTPPPPPSVADTAVPSTSAATDDTDDVAASPPPEPVASSSPLGVRGGPLLGVGLGALGLLALLAEGDRRKMRRAQRSAPTHMGAGN